MFLNEEKREHRSSEKAAVWGNRSMGWTDGQGLFLFKHHHHSHHPCQFCPPGTRRERMMFPLYREVVTRDSTLCCSSSPYTNTILYSMCMALHQWSTIHYKQTPSPASLYQAIFLPWGFMMYPSSIISKYYVYACLFSLFRIIDC